jgi:MFS superfamily sulfate permease-like transporter
MGYAEAAGLPAVCGLYATIVPLIAYAIFGPSRILVLGPDSSLAALIAATILPLSAGNPDRAGALAGMLAVLSGALCIAAGFARFGFVTELLSKPIRYGYVNGIALSVILGQLPTMLGFAASGAGALQRTRGVLEGIEAGRINWTACVISSASLLLILGCRRLAPRVPGVLVAVVGATLAVSFFDLAARNDVSVVGTLPQGLPGFRRPVVSLAEMQALASGAIAIAVISFADMSVLSRTFAQRRGEEVDANQELVALGIANVAAGLFRVFREQQFIADAGGESAGHGRSGRRGERVVSHCSGCRRRCCETCRMRPWLRWSSRMPGTGGGVRRGPLYRLRRSELGFSLSAFWA